MIFPKALHGVDRRRPEQCPHGTARQSALADPQHMDNQFEDVRLQLNAKRTSLVLRVPMGGGQGVAINSKTLPNLPPSMVQILSSGKTRTRRRSIRPWSPAPHELGDSGSGLAAVSGDEEQTSEQLAGWTI